MQENITEKKKLDITKLSNELTYQRYLFNRNQMKQIFQKLSVPEYIALQNISEISKDSAIYSGRTYLKDLAESMHLTIRQTSKMVGNLKDRGLLVWSHDGDGSEGTYVTITESGESLLSEHEASLGEYYKKVIGKFGEDNLIQLLQLMKQLDTVMGGELEGLEGEDNNETDE